ncbi:MAG: DUF5320 domain-containing protein [archaeon]
MPGGDGTGPMGKGPMTGRGTGFCAGFSTPGFTNPTSRLGIGFRRGYGNGARRRRTKVSVIRTQSQSQTQNQPQNNQNIQILTDKITTLEKQINQIKNKINQLVD